MNAHTRRSVAYITGQLVTASASRSVYDYSEGRYVSFTGDVTAQNVSVYDYEEGCYVSGVPSSLYHYGNGQHIQLNVNGTQCSGYDYASGHHFSGDVAGNSVTVYDYEHGQHFNSSV